MSSGDFLHKEAQTPLTEHYIMAGAFGSISTNSESILAAARECFCPVDTPSFEPRLRLRFFVDPKGVTQQPWPKPFFRGLDHLIFAGFDSQSSILIDLRNWRAIGRFSPALAADRERWKAVIFPALISIMGATMGITELHCGCVSRQGRGLLLVGRSGSGKSTLALALALAGFNYLTDDRTYISSWEGRITAWGLPTSLKLRPDAVEWFREFGDLDRALTKNGEQDLRVDPKCELGIERHQRCEPKGIFFLHRQQYSAFDLSPMPRAEAATQLEDGLIAETPDVIERQQGMIANLLDTPCWRLAYGGSPLAVAQEFSRLW
jgi:hypothetical protein